MNFTGKMVGLTENKMTGKYSITFELDEIPSSFDIFDKFMQLEKLSVDVKKYRNKRSKEANSYCWYLCTELAEKLSTSEERYTKEDIYRNAIREVGIYKDFHLPADEASTLMVSWSMLGTGWLTEQVDYEQDGENVVIRCYYGSSQYNTKQMSRLIDYLVQDALAVGDIDVLTDNDRNQMLKDWNETYKLNRKKIKMTA